MDNRWLDKLRPFSPEIINGLCGASLRMQLQMVIAAGPNRRVRRAIQRGQMGRAIYHAQEQCRRGERRASP
jgi:hypothetical protein